MPTTTPTPPETPEPNVAGVSVALAQPLPREAQGDGLIGLFMSFTVFAIWLLALAVF